MPKILGVEITKRSIILSQVHNAIEIIGMAAWLGLVLDHKVVLGTIVLAVTLTLEHIFALAAGKEA